MISSFLYESLYRDYRKSVLSYISARVSSPEDAEDLCEEVFVKLLKALDTFDGEKAAASTLLYMLTHNAVIDYYRRSDRHTKLSDSEKVLPSAEEVVMDTERAEELTAALEKLPVHQRNILILRFYGGWTLVKISEQLGITYDTVVSRQKSALKTLRKLLEKNQD